MAANYYKDANGKRYKIIENNVLYDGTNYYVINSTNKIPVQISGYTATKFQPVNEVLAEHVTVAHGGTSTGPVNTNTSKNAYVTANPVNVVSK